MAAGEPGQDPIREEDPRLASLEERLQAAHRAEAARTGTARKKPDASYSAGNRVLSDLISGVAGGALIGWVIDTWADTLPGFLLTFMFLGIVVAFRNIIKRSNERPK